LFAILHPPGLKDLEDEDGAELAPSNPKWENAKKLVDGRNKTKVNADSLMLKITAVGRQLFANM